VYQDGGLHNMLAGTGTAWVDCVSIGTPNGPASLFHLNGPGKGSPGAVYVRTRALGPGLLVGAPGRGGTAYYDHTSQTPNIIMLDVEAQGVSSFYNYADRCIDEGGSLYISGARFNDRAGVGARKGKPPALPYGTFGGTIGPNRRIYMEDVLAYTGSLNGLDVGAEEDEYVFRNGTIVYRQEGRVGALFSVAPTVRARFEHCTFIIDTYGENLSQPNLVTGPVKWGSVSTFTAAKGSLHFEKCVFVLEKANINYYMHYPYSTAEFNVTANDCLFTEGFVNLPASGGHRVSNDIFAKPRSWRDGDLTLSPTSPARELDAGARQKRLPVYRPQAEKMAKDILGYLP
ncbi:MAG: hypothetical protein Q8O57_12945, partial [Kiritimatiellota bacterium]|nr:hypothetical protein [Kiritimatiellota bacterium]